MRSSCLYKMYRAIVHPTLENVKLCNNCDMNDSGGGGSRRHSKRQRAKAATSNNCAHRWIIAVLDALHKNNIKGVQIGCKLFLIVRSVEARARSLCPLFRRRMCNRIITRFHTHTHWAGSLIAGIRGAPLPSWHNSIAKFQRIWIKGLIET